MVTAGSAVVAGSSVTAGSGVIIGSTEKDSRVAAASTVAPFYNLEPIVTTACAGLLFGEILTANQYAGGGIVLAALVVSSLLGKRENRA